MRFLKRCKGNVIVAMLVTLLISTVSLSTYTAYINDKHSTNLYIDRMNGRTEVNSYDTMSRNFLYSYFANKDMDLMYRQTVEIPEDESQKRIVRELVTSPTYIDFEDLTLSQYKDKMLYLLRSDEVLDFAGFKFNMKVYLDMPLEDIPSKLMIFNNTPAFNEDFLYDIDEIFKDENDYSIPIGDIPVIVVCEYDSWVQETRVKISGLSFQREYFPILYYDLDGSLQGEVPEGTLSTATGVVKGHLISDGIVFETVESQRYRKEEWDALNVDTSTYNVIFDANGGTGTMPTQTFTYNVPQALTANAFTRDGYKFGGWTNYKDSKRALYSNGQVVNNLTSGYGSVTLYAVWIPNTYTVEFNSNGGEGTMPSQLFTYGKDKRLQANTFTKRGYRFAGWSTFPNPTIAQYQDQEAVSNLTTEANGTVTLYAVWEANQYTIIFNANGGEGPDKTQTFAYDTAQKLDKNTFTKAGYHFVGWSTNRNDATPMYTDGESVINLSDTSGDSLTFYAIWAANDYTVQYDANGGEGTMQPQSFTYDKSQNLTGNTFTKVGYTFQGWATSKNATTVQYTDKANVVNLTETENGVVTLYAVWQENTYTVRFDANGGSGTMDDIVCKYDLTEITLTNHFAAPEGYFFEGWATSKAGPVVYADGESVKNLVSTNGGSITLYAKWHPNTYTITFHPNGGTGVMPTQTFTYDTAKALIANTFTRTGYLFDGWAMTPSGAVVYKDCQFAKNLTTGKDVTLYAKWKPITYTITFKPNGGEGTMPDQTLTYDVTTKLDANMFTKTGYSFIGWSKNQTGSVAYTDEQEIENLTTAQDGNIVLYAQWSPIVSTISFDANGGSVSITSKKVTYDSQYGELPVPTRDGYSFVGWFDNSKAAYDSNLSYKDNPWLYYLDTFPDLYEAFGYNQISARQHYIVNGQNEVWRRISQYLSTDTVKIVANTTLYAGWSKNYTVTFDANGGKVSPTNKVITSSSKDLELPVPTREGYTFVGWFDNSTAKYDSSLQYKDNPWLYYLDKYPDLYAAFGYNQVSARNHYSSNGKNEDRRISQYVSNDIAGLSGDTTLYAGWFANDYTITFNANGGTVNTSSKSVTYDGKYGELPVPTKTGYTFVGWFDDSTAKHDANYYYKNSPWLYYLDTYDDLFAAFGYSQASAKQHYNNFGRNEGRRASQYLSTDDVKITKDTTLYAGWYANNYTVVFNANGGTGVMPNQTFTYDITQGLISNTFTKTGYTFVGWSTSSTATSATYVNGQPINNLTATDGATITLYAVWETDMDWEYTLDKDTKTITLTKYIGNYKNVVAKGSYEIDGVLYDKVILGAGEKYNDYSCCLFDNEEDKLKSITIEPGVIAIGADAFLGCKNLTSIDIPGSVLDIKAAAFRASGLKGTLYLPEGVMYVRTDAFRNTQIDTLYTPLSLELLGSLCFYTAPITKIYDVGNNRHLEYACSNRDMENAGFDDDVSLTYNYFWVKDEGRESGAIPFDSFQYDSIDAKNRTINISKYVGSDTKVSISEYYTLAGVNYHIASIGESAFANSNGNSMTYLKLPNTVTSIGVRAFQSCSSLETLILSNRLKTIEEAAFQYCSKLTKLTLPSTLETMGKSAFKGCSSLTGHVNIPCYEVLADTFRNCKITSISIPNSVRIVYDAFKNCNTITDVYYAGTQSQFQSLYKGNYIPYYIYSAQNIHYNSSGPSTLVMASIEQAIDVSAYSIDWNESNVSAMVRSALAI